MTEGEGDHMRIEVSEIRFHAATHADIEGGLLGWTSFVLNGAVRIDGVALRRSVDNRPFLSFPRRRASGRRKHFYVRPLNDRARRDIEYQVLKALNLE
jgi:hypothetical protein